MAAEHRLKAPADLEQRSGRAVRHQMPDTVQTFYYSAAWLAGDSPPAETSTTGPQATVALASLKGHP